MASIGVVIVTYKAAGLIEACLRPILASPLRPRVLVVNSTSNDGTVEKARDLGAETWVVPRHAFNHGATREAARRRLGTDIVVMLTPDAHATDAGFLGRLVAPIVDGRASVAYGRQVPRPGADFVEAFGRAFSYPEADERRGLVTRHRHGAYNHFCSNACCAWRQSALDAIGGFSTALVSEETIAAARLIERGRTLAYVASAVVVHSHPTSLIGGFRRQFDVGLTRSVFEDVLLAHEADERRGRAYLKRLVREAPAAKLPYALIDTAVRYAGYRLGRFAGAQGRGGGRRPPRRLAALFSGQDFFWRSTHQDAFWAGAAPSPPARGRLADAA